MERRIREIFNWESKKEREYKSLARDIIDAIEAKIQESGKHEFKIPFPAQLILGGLARCSVWTSLADTRTAVIIEEEKYPRMNAERGVTIISEDIDRDFPFVRFREEISNGSDLNQLTHSDKNSRYDLRPTMLSFLEDIKKWEIVT